ncbi:MAG: hypothetical protein ACXAD7_09865 [Candidatus Kariarchaeaceae archaeon]|jgi:hypothetical protein
MGNLYSQKRITKYYSELPENNTIITDFKFRHFRFKLPSGAFKKIPYKINSISKLKKWIKRYPPLDIYYSVARYLNPHLVGIKGIDDPMFLNMDLVFDIDDPFDLQTALVKTRRILNYGVERRWILKYVSFSGSKGFHIVYHDPFEEKISKISLPEEREEQSLESRKNLVEQMKEENYEFDFKVTADTRRIIRLPFSIHPKTGYICTPLDKKTINTVSINQILKGIRKVNIKSTFGSLFWGNDTCFKKHCTLLGFLYRSKVRSETIDPSHFYTTYVTNRILGTRLGIPIFYYYSWNNRLKRKLELISQLYNLGKIYVFEVSHDHSIYAVSLKALQLRRIEKVLKAADSRNIGKLKKYNLVKLEIGPRKSIKLEQLGTTKIIDIVGHDDGDNASKGHYNLLHKMGVQKRIESKHLIGKDKYEIEYVIAEP